MSSATATSYPARLRRGRRTHQVVLDGPEARSLCRRAGGWIVVVDRPVDCPACLARLARASR